MSFFRKFFVYIMILAMLGAPLTARAAGDTEDYIQRMIQYYLTYQEDAEEEIAVLLEHISESDPDQGRMWRNIMESWAYNHSQLQVDSGMLCDGLPQDDSLCIVIMGYGLNRNGSMKEELIDRLVVGLSSALKYPNAYVAVTGGATSDVKGVTEAGQMSQWLQERGITADRLIVESKALSTIENAQNVHKILMDSYPQVTSIAVVTSDYHIRQSCSMFTTMSHYASGARDTRALDLVGCAANSTGRSRDTLSTEAWGISLITGVPYDATPKTLPQLSR